MAKLKFPQGTNLFNIEEAVFRPLIDGSITEQTSEKLVYTDAAGYQVVFQGSFTVVAGFIILGTINDFDAYAGSTQVLDGTGYEIDFIGLTDAIGTASTDDTALRNFLFDTDVKKVGAERSDTLVASFSGGSLYGHGGGDFLYGLAGEDLIVGGRGSDFIQGNAGVDTLYGKAGNNVFVMTDPATIDKVKDFSAKHDLMAFDENAFDQIGPGYLDASEFHVGKQATTAEQRIIYTKSTGALYYDADGSGVTEQVQIAKLSKHLDLDADNFLNSGLLLI